MNDPSRRGDVGLAASVKQFSRKQVLAVACIALLVWVLGLTASSRGGDVSPVGHSAEFHLAAMTGGLQEVPVEADDDVAQVGVHRVIFDKIDGAVHIQGIAMLTWPCRLDGEVNRVRVLTVAVNAVVLHHGYTTSHLLTALFSMEQVDCSSSEASSGYLTVDLDELPPDGLEQFAESTLATPHKRYVLHLRPRGDLTWGQVSEGDQVDFVIEARGD